MGGDMAEQLGLFLQTAGLPAVFLILLLKEMGIPVPLPGDFVMLFAGVQAARGAFDPWLALLAITAAAGLGSSVIYLLARGPGRSIIYRFGRYIGLTPARLDMAAQTVQKRGIVAVFIGRATPGLGLPTTAAAGIGGISYQVYIVAALVSSMIFAGLHVLLGYVAGPVMMDALENLHIPVLPIVLGLALLGLAFWLVRRARRKGWEHAACPACMVLAVAGERALNNQVEVLAPKLTL
jgi:membrane protein DedA with SNARE-associated domain